MSLLETVSSCIFYARLFVILIHTLKQLSFHSRTVVFWWWGKNFSVFCSSSIKMFCWQKNPFDKDKCVVLSYVWRNIINLSLKVPGMHAHLCAFLESTHNTFAVLKHFDLLLRSLLRNFWQLHFSLEPLGLITGDWNLSFILLV